jgi:hypothetical protein
MTLIRLYVGKSTVVRVMKALFTLVLCVPALLGSDPCPVGLGRDFPAKIQQSTIEFRRECLVSRGIAAERLIKTENARR